MIRGHAIPRLGVISIHPAPYRDPTFALVHRRQVVEIQVLTMFPMDIGHPYQDLDGSRYPNIFLPNGHRISDNVFWHPQIISLLRAGKFDGIVVPGYNHITCIAAMLYCWTTGTPLIFSTDNVLFTPDSTVHRPARQWLMRQILNRSAAVWVPGSASRQYARYYGVPDDRIFEGSYCLDAQFLGEMDSKARSIRSEVRARLGLDAEDFLFLFAGRMVPERGLRILVDAYLQVARRGKRVGLLLIGDGPQRKELEAVVAQRQPAGIRFLDPMPIAEITEYYAASDAYVLPSISEHYSLALAHAAIASLPVIATDHVGAVPDYVLEKETGCVVPAGDPCHLADAMAWLSSDVLLAQRLGRRARDVASRRTTEWAARQLEAALNTASGRRRG
jgi:glycosyltransferase involved in cell wall biosynthesis